MQKIKIYLEYHCFPVWIYNNGELICNDLPKELLEDKEVDNAFVEIQNIYDSLFLNSSTEFKYIGFNSESDRQRFLQMVDVAVTLMESKIGDSYVVEKKIDV